MEKMPNQQIFNCDIFSNIQTTCNLPSIFYSLEFLLSTFVKTCFESRFHNVINVVKKWVFSTIPTNKELQMVKYTKPSSSVLRAKVAQQRFSYFSWTNWVSAVAPRWSVCNIWPFWQFFSMEHLEVTITVFENHRKSLILHCERSELLLHFEWTKVH